jgi:hypothetical protein
MEPKIGCVQHDCAKCQQEVSEIARITKQRDELVASLSLAVRQNSHDMMMTGDELRICEETLAKVKESKGIVTSLMLQPSHSRSL